jgi:hypothetical protein
MNRNPKKCIVCGMPFIPDHRVGQNQKVCQKLSCKLERKRRAQARWLKKNPDYFKGRYPQLKEAIIYNQQHKAIKTHISTTIQDELTTNKNKQLNHSTLSITIQDELRQRITMAKRCLTRAAILLYKTS